MTMYKTLSQHYREKFGCKVYKLAIDGGFTCPNRDGTVGYGGCIFCSGSGSGDFAEHGDDIAQQLEQAKSRVAFKNKGGKYIAYFQSFTNTYAPLERLEKLYTEAMVPQEIVGLSIGTRPDCLSPQTIELLSKLNRVKPVSVELGLQTIHADTAKYIRRGYETAVYFDAVKRLKDAGLEVVTHIILGLPGESKQMMVQTTQAAIDAGTNGIKFQLLHVLKGTDLAKDYKDGKFQCLTLQEYAEILKHCLSLVPQHIVIHRITGDGAKKDLIAPLWSADKKAVLHYLNEYLAK
jgi:radical SAM protein (TIGR01212 family)